jgi:hypothetical protein
MNSAKKKNLKIKNTASSIPVFFTSLEVAFSAGNYWQVRKLVSNIKNDNQASERDKALASSISDRIKADPAVLALGVVAIISFILASWVSLN